MKLFSCLELNAAQEVEKASSKDPGCKGVLEDPERQAVFQESRIRDHTGSGPLMLTGSPQSKPTHCWIHRAEDSIVALLEAEPPRLGPPRSRPVRPCILGSLRRPTLWLGAPFPPCPCGECRHRGDMQKEMGRGLAGRPVPRPGVRLGQALTRPSAGELGSPVLGTTPNAWGPPLWLWV